MSSIPQTEAEVKCEPTMFVSPDECEVEWCHEPVFRDGLCWACYVAEQDILWDDEDAEREACLAGVGAGSYVWGDRYKERKARALWWELKHVYPDLAPPDERTPEERRRDAKRAKVELFG